MKTYLLLIINILLHTNIFCQDFKSGVKKVYIYLLMPETCEKKFRTSQYYSYYSDGTLKEKKETRYRGNEKSYEEIYKYHPNGIKQEIREIWYEGNIVERAQIQTFEYDDKMREKDWYMYIFVYHKGLNFQLTKENIGYHKIFKYNAQDSLIEVRKRCGNDRPYYLIKRNFDNKNRLTSEITFGLDDMDNTKDTSEYIVYRYNIEGELIYKSEIDKYKKWKKDYYYKNSKLISTNSSMNDKLIYKESFDYINDSTTEITSLKNEKIEKKEIITQGKHKKEIITYLPSNNYYEVSYYNNLKQLLETYSCSLSLIKEGFKSKNEIAKKILYLYDSKGNLINTKEFRNDELYSELIYEIEY